METVNWALVGVNGLDMIVIQNPGVVWPMTKERALLLAAWIVAVSDDGHVHDGGRFPEILHAVLNP